VKPIPKPSAPTEPKPKPKPIRKPLMSASPGCPWSGLDEAGTGLSVDDFLTTVTSRAANALRRAITVPYADRHGLSVSEWRLLSVLAEARAMSFADLVVASVSDKAMVSRTLRLLQERGWVRVDHEGSNPRWKQIHCSITPAGQALHRKVMPAARRAQAAMIHRMSPEERLVVYRSLKMLRAIGEALESAGDDSVAE